MPVSQGAMDAISVEAAVDHGPDELVRARELLEVDAAALIRAAGRLGPPFLEGLRLLDASPGKVVATGVGKSGLVARKLAATFTSLGSPAVFLHPTEALHGDLGLVEPRDVALAVSSGGRSTELLELIPALRGRGVPIVAIVGDLDSPLARAAEVVLDASIEREGCPLNLTPTASVVVSLALGDALAVALGRRRGLDGERYAGNHPGGRLGRRLTFRVRDLMVAGPEGVPRVDPDAELMAVLVAISGGCLGAACVTGLDGVLLGLITDYDVRHALQGRGPAALDCHASAIMTRRPAVVLRPEQHAFEALRQMRDRPRPVAVAPVVDEAGRCVGMTRLLDLTRAGL